MPIHKVFIEHMPRLRCANIHISHSADLSTPSLQIRERHIELPPHTIHLPATLHFDPSTMAGLVLQPDRIAFRVCTIPVATETNGNNTFDMELLSLTRAVGERIAPPARLSKLLPSVGRGERVRWQCARCSHWLTECEQFERVLELPSENVDAGEWFCHHHQTGNAADAAEHQAGHSHSHDKNDTDEDIEHKSNWAQVVGRPRDLLYGQYCFVISHVRLSGTQLTNDQVRCGQCRHVLGVYMAQQQMAKLWNETVAFVPVISATESAMEVMQDQANTTSSGAAVAALFAEELLHLPDEVLLLILDKLQLRDLTTVARVCTRLQYLADDLAAHRLPYRHLDYQRMQHDNDHFQPNADGAATFEQCMRFIGPHVQRIRFDGNLLQQHRNAAFAAVPVDEYEAFYEHQSALTVELRQFAHFEAFWPLVERWFGSLVYVQLSFESGPGGGGGGLMAAGCGKPSDAWRTRDLGADCRALHSYGFHVDDRRLALIFRHYPVDGLYVECPDLEKSAVGGSGAGGCHEWSGFKGTALAELGDLRRLELVHCNRFQPQNFNMFASANGASMQQLVIRECAQLCISPLVFRDAGMQFERLCHLEAYFLDTCPALDRLRELRHLRYLRLHMASDCDRLLEDLAVNDRLEELHIIDCLVDFSSPGFEDFALGTAEFFTHLRRVTLHGNILTAPILARFGNGEYLEVLRFTFELALAGGLVQLVRISHQLRELEMYCTEWVTLATMRDVVDALGERNNGVVLKILLTLEMYGGEDGERIENVVDKFEALSKRNAHLIDIVIV